MAPQTGAGRVLDNHSPRRWSCGLRDGAPFWPVAGLTEGLLAPIRPAKRTVSAIRRSWGGIMPSWVICAGWRPSGKRDRMLGAVWQRPGRAIRSGRAPQLGSPVRVGKQLRIRGIVAVWRTMGNWRRCDAGCGPERDVFSAAGWRCCPSAGRLRVLAVDACRFGAVGVSA